MLFLEVLGTSEELASKNAKLKVKVQALTSEFKDLNAKLKTLTKHLMDDHATGASRMDMSLKSFTPKPPFS